MPRCFAAAELSADRLDRIERALSRLGLESPEVRWSHGEKIQLTLKFFGEIEKDRVPSALEAQKRISPSAMPFEIEVQGCGVFPERGAPRVFWLGLVEGVEPFSALAAQVEESAAALGFARITKNWRSWLSKARNDKIFAFIQQENSTCPASPKM